SSSGGIVATLLSIKRVVIARLGQIVPEPHASFLAGLIFGGSSSLSQDLKDDFSKTGTSHILAASGFNVSLFSMVFLTWITHTFLGRRRGAYLTAGLLVAYVCVAGATAAVVRAGIMGLLVLVGFVIRRKPSVLNVTLLALAAMLLWNPLLLADVGFQLSFVATAAMLGASGAIEKRCVFVPEAFELRKSFAGSMAAIVCTLPIMLWHFGAVSLWSPVVNLLVLPLVPMLMALTGVALAVGFLNVTLGTIVAIPAWAASSVILHLVTWFGAL
ncbi:ComEC/Rec2 family competence protein, partial [bacterium]|nr:ComEC/Rec2 family competence protein [bacterium]